MKLSIVIPVYNVEKYVNRCLLSVLNQKVSSNEYEIVIVNDGSTDSSLSIVEEMIESYNNVILVSQENAGLSAARNRGLLLAKGDYIWFVDSDDWIDDDSLISIFPYLDSNIDLLQLQYCYAYDDCNKNEIAPFVSFESEIEGKELMLMRKVLPPPAQFCIYRRDFLLQRELFFTPNILHEDLDFKPKAIYFAKRIASIDKVVYNYYQRQEGSITGNFKLKNAIDLIFVANDLLRFVSIKNISHLYAQYYYIYISLILNLIFANLNHLSQWEQKSVISLLYKNKSLFRCMLLSGSLKYFIEGLFFCFNITIGLKLYSVLKNRVCL